jgi:hypothetical protein
MDYPSSNADRRLTPTARRRAATGIEIAPGFAANREWNTPEREPMEWN